MRFLTDRRLHDVGYMASQNISDLYPGMLGQWARGSNDIIATVLNRLAWLIQHMERNPNDYSCACARWYLDHFVGHVPLPRWHTQYTTPYVSRLRAAIAAHEARTGYPAPIDWFARLVGTSELGIRSVLYGPPARYTLPPRSYILEETLDSVISTYCWKSTLNN